MTKTIQSNAAGASELALRIQESLDEYLSFTLSDISISAPVSGSVMHSEISNSVISALGSWSDLIISDANALESACRELAGTDESVARQLLGVGCAAP